MKKVKVLVKRCQGNDDLPIPSFATDGSSGFDLAACIEDEVMIKPGERVVIPTGFAIALPEGFEAQVRPRSGTALKFGLTMVNSPGTIDSDYRGEIKVIAINLGREPIKLKRGERIAQMVVSEVPKVELIQVDDLPSTKRGSGGFGHTG
ncbi:MAG: dUTP diphosphatase [Acidobacteriota bacterium]